MFWPESVGGHDTLRKHTLSVMPCFVVHTTASNEFEALEVTMPALRLSKLVEFAKKVPFVFLNLAGDLAPSNLRMKMAVAA